MKKSSLFFPIVLLSTILVSSNFSANAQAQANQQDEIRWMKSEVNQADPLLTPLRRGKRGKVPLV